MTMASQNIILASASPRRRTLLSKINIKGKFDILPSNYRESLPMDLTPAEMTMYLSLRKAQEVAYRKSTPKDSLVLAADTIVLVDGEIYGKPDDKKDAYRMLKNLSGRSHHVISGIALLRLADNIKFLAFDSTEVMIGKLTDNEILQYIESLEPMDKAGAYAIQGEFADHITGFKGSYDNVVGLPTELLNTIIPTILTP